MSNSAEIHYFKEFLTKVGVSLQYNDTPNIYQKEQSLISRDMKTEFEEHPSYPNNIAEFISGLKYLIKKEKLFKKALLPSLLQSITDEECVQEQESLFRLFLSVDCIQTEIINVILEQVTIRAVEDQHEDINIGLRLLLAPLINLSYIKTPQQITKNLLEILEVATFQAQIEILNVISNIIPHSEYDETAKHLTQILNQNGELTRAIIDCLDHLILSPDTITDIQDQLLAILHTTMSLQTLSLIYCFLVNNCKPNMLANILMKTRNALDSIIICQSGNGDIESEHVLVFDKLRKKSSKSVCEGWISLINNIRRSSDHKSVDILLLLMLHSSGNSSKHQIESIFKKKIKNRLFKTSLLETTFQKYLAPQILREYFESILEIATFLLRNPESLCLEFAKILYVTTFGHKHADKQQRQKILYSLISLTGIKEGRRTIPALNILELIAEKNLKLLKPHAKQLMELLDKLEQINLGEVKQIFDILCSLICGPQSDESINCFQNDIHIIVRKQLRSAKKSLKYRGIIAAVSTAKYTGCVLEESESMLSEASYASITDLPEGAAKQAATLLEMTNQSTLNCPIARGLYYDQLAQMVVTMDNLDKYLMAWLFDTITLNFQETYLTETGPEPINDIPIKIQYNLNEELETPIAVNLAELTINSTQNMNSMLVFAPLFRLLRLIHYRQHEGNLDTIDALLGCGIALPEIDIDIGIDSFDSEQSKQVVNCLFHCINWFREIISAFVTQKDKSMKKKVLTRLKELVELEELFLSCMKTMPDHKLPPCYFYNINLDVSNNTLNLDRTKLSDTRKRKRSAAQTQQNTTKFTQTQAGTSTTTLKTGKGKPGKPANKDKEPTEYQFREMDTDILVLLKYPIIVEMEATQQLHLNLSQYKFIIKDLVMKLNNVTKPSTQSALTHLITVKPENLVTDCIHLMPHINKHLIKIIDETKKLIERCDGIHDCHEMFITPAIELKLCFSLTLELQSLVLNWIVNHTNKNLPLLREFLGASVEIEASQSQSAKRLIIEYLKCITKMVDYCLTLPCAVHLINIIQSLCNFSEDTTPKKKLILLSGKLLSNRWFNLNGLPETGAIANIHMDALVKAHLNGSNLETISSVVSWIHAECQDLKSKDDNLTTFPSITKSNFPILFRGVCSVLYEALQTELHGLTNTEHLDVWLNTVTTMRSLMDIVKKQENRMNLSAFLKRSMSILKHFLAQGLPILEIMLRSHSDKVVEILRTLQQTTRFIHNLCCHSKVTKDSALIAHVPQMRLTLETLVYRVKAVLVANNCSSAFWMGNLRNKNLHGEEILTQSTNTSTNEEDGGRDSEEELPADDSDSETVISGTDGVPEDNTSDII